MDDKLNKVTRLRQLLQEASAPVEVVESTPDAASTRPAGLTRDDTLGAILRAAEPAVRRYVKTFSWVGLVTLPIRFITLYVAAGSLLELGGWAAKHDPFWMFKWLGGVASLAFLIWIMRELYLAERDRWRRKRALKNP